MAKNDEKRHRQNARWQENDYSRSSFYLEEGLKGSADASKKFSFLFHFFKLNEVISENSSTSNVGMRIFPFTKTRTYSFVPLLSSFDLKMIIKYFYLPYSLSSMKYFGLKILTNKITYTYKKNYKNVFLHLNL